jgi:hypothetical protein
MSAFYAATGEKSEAYSVRVSLIPADRVGFAERVFKDLGGVRFERKIIATNREEAQAQNAELAKLTNLERLAEESLRYLQLQEALGRPPRRKEFTRIEYRLARLNADVDQAWEKYVTVIEAALRGATSLGGRSLRETVEYPASDALARQEAPPAPPVDQASVRNPRSWLGRLLRG